MPLELGTNYLRSPLQLEMRFQQDRCPPLHPSTSSSLCSILSLHLIQLQEVFKSDPAQPLPQYFPRKAGASTGATSSSQRPSSSSSTSLRE
mmetsp:Transcript_34160/g.79847  ORF Transcript_34160/g.79847 Transcript_34160/m.79847 type:complete len:91 (+) Transcript_34160:1220-1492(+)